MRRLIWSCCCSICWRTCSTAAASTFGAVNACIARWRSAAAGLGLRLQVGRRAGGDLLDLAALRVARVEAVEHVVDHPAHALGRAAEHHAAAHAAVHAAHAVVHAAHAVALAPAVHAAHSGAVVAALRKGHVGPLLAGRGGAGCAHADRLSAASSVISMPIITHWTRRAVDAVAAIATALLISLLLRPTAGEWQ